MLRKLDNKGLTLVELVLAIAMSTIVVGAATMFLYNAERSYRISEYSVDLQMEAQLLMEQMSNWVLESNYIEVKGSSGESVLVLYNIPRTKMNYDKTDNMGTASRMIIYPHGEKLYRKYEEVTDPTTYINEIKNDSLSLTFVTSEDPDPLNCIGEYVQNFDVALPEGVSSGAIRSVEVTLSMHEGRGIQAQSYIASDIFSLRNRMYQQEVEESAAPTEGEETPPEGGGETPPEGGGETPPGDG